MEKSWFREFVARLLFSMIVVGASFLPIQVPAQPPAQAAETQPQRILPFSVKHVWLGRDGQPLPIQQEDAILEFLENAEIVSSEEIGDGINKFRRLQLSRDGVELRAIFRDVKTFKRKTRLRDGRTIFNFRDDCDFEVAAYRISKLLGLSNVPPVVRRKWNRTWGTIQLWMEKTMTESIRLGREEEAPNQRDWLLQWQTVRLFDNLIYNDDRNSGNILIDSDWKVWMIDHTRAFLEHREPKNHSIVRYCDRVVWQKLQALDRDEVRAAVKGLITNSQVDAIMKRRDVLVQYLQQEIETRGERDVLF